MAKKYTAYERYEAVNLASEIGIKAASARLGINIDTLYTWTNKSRRREEALNAVVKKKGPEALAEENEALKKQLRDREQEVEVLQEALSFFVKRRKK